MATEVKCPNCGVPFPIEEVMAEEYKKELRAKMQEYTQQKEDEYRKKENDFANREKQQAQVYEQRLAEEKKQLCDKINAAFADVSVHLSRLSL